MHLHGLRRLVLWSAFLQIIIAPPPLTVYINQTYSQTRKNVQAVLQMQLIGKP